MSVIDLSLPETCIILQEPEVLNTMSPNLTDVKIINNRGHLIKIDKFNAINATLSTHGVRDQ